MTSENGESDGILLALWSNRTEERIMVENCPNYSKADLQLVDEVSFWMEGVSQTIIAILGIIGNIVASIILSRKEMRNAFNLLLVTMACFDSTYLFGSILESFRKQFNLASNLHIILFPCLLYPFNQIAITASIFMTVAIALERFIAVHYPLNYSQAMHEANALTKRIVKYVASVTSLAILFTVTRFFEAKVVYIPIVDKTTNETVDYVPSLEPTDLRTAPIYTTYFNWSRLIVLGIIPFVMLVYLNVGIYKDIKARKNRRLNPRHHQQKGRRTSRFPAWKWCMERKSKDNDPHANGNFASVLDNHLDKTEMIPLGAAEAGSDNNKSPSPSTPQVAPSVNKELVVSDAKPIIKSRKVLVRLSRKKAPPAAAPAVTVNESRRKKEDNLAVIFMGFIMVFLMCHLPRLLLNIHELATIRQAMKCQEAGLQAFPLWSLVTISLSHLLLVINSATNILIYCCLSSKFREECRKVFRKF